jgi:hypothetical protein
MSGRKSGQNLQREVISTKLIKPCPQFILKEYIDYSYGTEYIYLYNSAQATLSWQCIANYITSEIMIDVSIVPKR